MIRLFLAGRGTSMMGKVKGKRRFPSTQKFRGQPRFSSMIEASMASHLLLDGITE
jgi:hypothetical protein